MAKFKIGDKVRCVDGTDHVQLGAEGVLARINGEANACYVNWSTLDKIVATSDNSWWIKPSQIELIEPEPAKFKVGDTVYDRDMVDKTMSGVIIEAHQMCAFIRWNSGHESFSIFKNLSHEPFKPVQTTPAPPDTAKLARIERWVGLAMQVMNDKDLGSYEQVALRSFDYADAMEAEFQRRYNNNNNEQD